MANDGTSKQNEESCDVKAKQLVDPKESHIDNVYHDNLPRLGNI